ncbi:DUF6603 domain-containing protein [Streptomyces sp. NPDC048718]|uniref:DUF6603 domain-containing protein n=1 Tax=Streptomyces sp. NPDC048718 TaxID=3365587 RepID=UPI00372233FF
MTAQVDVVRKLLEEARGETVEIPVETLGFGDRLRVLFPEGVLRVRANPIESEGVTRSGQVAFGDGSAPLCLSVRPDGPHGATAAVEVELPAPGASAHLLARCLGFELPPLPCAATDRLSLSLDDAAGAALTAAGPHTRVQLHTNAGRVFHAAADGWQVVCTDLPLTLRRLAVLTGNDALGAALLPDPFSDRLPAGAWLLPPDLPLRPRRALVPLALPRPAVTTDSSRVDGLGRPLPAPRPKSLHPHGGGIRPARAVATADGFALLAGGGDGGGRGNGRWDLHIGEDGSTVSVDYDYSPLRVSGALALLPASEPYESVVGGVLMFSFGGGAGENGKPSQGLYGTGMGAYVVPRSGAAKPSFFGYAGIGGDPGIGIPAIRVTGISAGLGWNSRIRLPEISEIGNFPFLRALDDPGAIGAEREDPVEIIKSLTTGDDAWVAPVDDELWVAAGLGFSIAELITGRALAVVQTGPELTIALLGTGAAELPKGAGRKYARIAAALRAVLKPNQGELAFDAELTGDSFVIDPNCKLRGGVAFRAWFGTSPHAGDFVYTVGGYHPNYDPPERYPVVPRLGFDWDLTGSVTISGSAYLAITPAAAMAGGSLDVRFHSGVVKAWCTAKVDALIQWKPFYLDVGLQVRIGVSASVKIVFVRVTITVEVGVSLGIWGPPTGGQAKVKLWFISFTINFGKGHESAGKVLDWPGFAGMLPPPANNLRVTPGTGLVAEKHPDTLGDDPYWEVSSNGFTFTTDSTVPVSRMFLGDATEPAESGDSVDIRPMRRQGLTSGQRVRVTSGTSPVDPADWSRSRSTATMPAELWGPGSPGNLPSGDRHLVKDQLVGVRLTSPAPRHGTSTGYMDEKALAFDPVAPDGVQPLDPGADPAGAVPWRPDGVIATIAATIAASGQTAARSRLAGQLAALGLDLGTVDSDLSRYALAARTAFTAEPMLVPAN